MAAPLALGAYSLFVALFGPVYGASAFAGAVSGYITYDLFHYFLHHGTLTRLLQRQKSGSASTSSASDRVVNYLGAMKSYHMGHHYKDYHEGYGITTKFWDWVFGTALTP